MRETDRAYIEESWLNSHKSSARAQDAGEAYIREHKRTIRALIARSTVRVACLADDDDAILGFAVWEVAPIPVLHYVFVRQAGRRTGIASALVGELAALVCEYSHRPARSNGVMVLPRLWRYNPYRSHA